MTPTAPRRDRPEASPLQAAGRRPLLVALVVILCTALGILAGFLREPVYTAQARLSVGSIDVPSQALPGYVEATKSLAEAYSRSVESPAIVDRVAQRTGTPAEQVRSSLTASPIPESPVILLEAKTGEARRSVAVADSGAAALLDYIRGLTASADDQDALLREFRQATIELDRALASRRAAGRRYEAAQTPRNSQRLRSAKADAEAARLRVQSLSTRYEAAQQRQFAPDFVQVVTRPQAASSDRTAGIQLRGFAGLVVGVIAALALATLLSRRSRTG